MHPIFDNHPYVRENATMTVTATATKPAKNDKVRLTVDGTFGSNTWGDTYVEDEKGNKIFLSNEFADRVTVVQKQIPEPTLTGSIVRVGASQYVKKSDGKWHFINTAAASTYQFQTTFDVLADGKTPDRVSKLVPVPFSYQNRGLTAGWVKYEKPNGFNLEAEVRNGKLTFTNGHALARDEAVQFARDILRAYGLEA